MKGSIMGLRTKKYYGNPNDDDGDLVLFSHEPYAIEDTSLVDKVIKLRDPDSIVTFKHKGVSYAIESYYKGKAISRTLVKNLDLNQGE
jgi:hypothetical protein